MNLEPIGIYHSAQRFRFETPRQSVFIHNSGVITLQPNRNFETALEDLEGFDRIWVIFQFHLNDNWRPKVRPPVAPEKERIGVFATRSPHRPNPIGMSCVKLEKVEGLNIFVQDCDLLDESPVFDIKPYIPAADSFPEARTGWLERAVVPQSFEVSFTENAKEKLDFLKENGFDAENFCIIQLGSDPVNPERKRIYRTANGYEIGFRTWRIAFHVSGNAVTVYDVRSNYLPEELLDGVPDKYGDKPLHRAFKLHF
ncbi:MAG: tRNA (N6-threonylcarbamoyladenosine(37)-N6)-methyltransferase TrmO [Lentisphaerae bacterium]|nr:tRNA (N6-threonylcarbamoyladenosine(37)-N6)-methyltransferase TrmO [Lentisphaerota bacterium]